MAKVTAGTRTRTLNRRPKTQPSRNHVAVIPTILLKLPASLPFVKAQLFTKDNAYRRLICIAFRAVEILDNGIVTPPFEGVLQRRTDIANKSHCCPVEGEAVEAGSTPQSDRPAGSHDPSLPKAMRRRPT